MYAIVSSTCTCVCIYTCIYVMYIITYYVYMYIHTNYCIYYNYTCTIIEHDNDAIHITLFRSIISCIVSVG